MAILTCPSLVGIPILDLGNILSVLEALWVQTLWRIVMFSIFKQKSQKTTAEYDNSPSSHNIQNAKILSQLRT